MSDAYRIFGSELSPYSVKVRSYFRFKSIPHEWIARGIASEADYQKHAKLPIVPTVVAPDGAALQDSTPIIEKLDPLFPTPSIHPEEPALNFLSTLIEEFGDEWGNKLMFHHRWYDAIDARVTAHTLARLYMPHGTRDEVLARADAVFERMTKRGHFVGSSDATAPLITDYYIELLDILEPHFASRKYLFGARPSFGDFGLGAQLYEASVDPTCGSIMRGRAQNVLDWCYRMIEPREDGPFETWESLAPTMKPLLDYIGRYFLPWTNANATALQQQAESFSVDLAGRAYVQPPQKYHAKSLAVLKARYREAPERAAIDRVLAGTQCIEGLA